MPVNGAIDPVLAGRSPASDTPSGFKREYAGLLEYWQMIRRHKLPVVLATVLGLAAGFLLTLPEPRIYQARTTLEIQSLNDDFLNMKNVSPTAMAGTSSPEYEILTQVRILQSRSLLNRVVEKLKSGKRSEVLAPPDRISAWRKALGISPPTPEQLWRQAVGIAAGSIKVKASGTHRNVEVSCDSTSPKVAAEFLNTLTEEFIEQNLEARWKSSEHTGEWLTKQLQDLKIKLERSEDQLQSYARSTGLVISAEKNADDTKLTDAQKQLSEAESDRVNKQSKFELAAASPADAMPEILDDKNYQDTLKTIVDLKRQFAQLRVTFTPSHPDVKRVESQIQLLEASLAKQRADVLTRIRNEYQGAVRKEKLLASPYNGQAGLVSAQATKSAHYNLLKREVDTTRLLYETMLQKLKEASIASALRASNIRAVDPAEAPTAPYKPDVFRSTIVGLLAGASLGVGFAVMRERADRTLQDPGDPAYYLGLPDLGVVPAGQLELTPSGMKVRPRTQNGTGNGVMPESEIVAERLELATWNRKSSLLAESFRTALTSILFSNHTESRPRVLVFTSASPKEGKTTVVCNMSTALAEIGHKVLLIDADMRRPRLHRVFDVNNEYGLSNLLVQRGPVELSHLQKAKQETVVPGLYILSSGSARHSISSLLHSERLIELLPMARGQFDTIVIDMPPMVNISDARVLARYSDAVILVIRSNVTTRDAALGAKRRFAEDGIQVFGTILNGWNPNTPGYGYYRNYYAGYYHYYGKDEEKPVEVKQS